MKNINYKNKPLLIITLGSLLILGMTGCKKFLSVDLPSNQLIVSSVFSDDRTANAALAGLYGKISAGPTYGGGIESLTILPALSSDEAQWFENDNSIIHFSTNSLTSENPVVAGIWAEHYNIIYLANSILEGLKDNTKITDSIRQELIGEAMFIRAFTHFYLANSFGSIPYVKTTDYEQNTKAFRIPVADIYEMAIEDLLEAYSLLSNTYAYSKDEKTRPNKFVASALLARIYLFTEDWANAEIQATQVINETSKFNIEDDLNNVFIKNSFEAIWQLMPVNQTYTTEGNFFINGGGYYMKLTEQLLSSFEVDDDRKTSWIIEQDIDFDLRSLPYKYKENPSQSSGNEYYMVLRLAEQFLIRAEARARQDNIIGANSAEDDLNVIRTRAGLNPTTANTKEQMLMAIMNERRVEFFAEWGHRWFDLKRTNQAENALDYKEDWQNFDQLYPIPESEVLINKNLGQNDGY